MKNLLLILFLFPFALSQMWHGFEANEYFVGRESVVRSAATEMCQNMSATLVIVDSEDIMTFLINLFNNLTDVPRSFWIGLSLANLPTPQLRWVNGDPLNYTNWNNEDEVEQVTNDNEACIVMGHPCCAGNLTNYAWFSVDCNDQFSTTGHPSYICQRPKVVTSISTGVIAATTTTTSSTRTTQSKSTLDSTRTASNPISKSFGTLEGSKTTTITQTTTKQSTTTSTNVKEINEPNRTSEEIQGVELSTVIAIVVPMLIIIIALMVFIICIVFKRRNKSDSTKKTNDVKKRPTVKVDKENISLPHIDDDQQELETAVYVSTTSLEISKEKGPKKPLYSQVNKSKEPSDRKSMEIEDDEDEWDDDDDDANHDEENAYTTIPIDDDEDEKTEADNQEKKSNFADPYITFSDMQSLSESTYSLRHSVHEQNDVAQESSDLYNTLDQSR